MQSNLVEEGNEDIDGKWIPHLDLGLSINTGEIVLLRYQRLELLQFQYPEGSNLV